MESPRKMDVRKVISVKAEPTAAQGISPQSLADDQRVRDVVELLQQISRHHGQSKEKEPPGNASFG